MILIKRNEEIVRYYPDLQKALCILNQENKQLVSVFWERLEKEGIKNPNILIHRLYAMGLIKKLLYSFEDGNEAVELKEEGKRIIEKIIEERREIIMKNLTDFQKKVIRKIDESEEEWVEKKSFKDLDDYNSLAFTSLVAFKIIEEDGPREKIKLTGHGKKVAKQIIEKEKKVDKKTALTENPTTPNITTEDKIPILAKISKQNQTTQKNPVKWQECLTNIGKIFDEAKREKMLTPEVKRKLGEWGMKSPDNPINILVGLGFITKTIPPGTDVSVIEITDKGYEFLIEPEKFSDIQPYAKSSKPTVTPKTDESSETQEKLKTENVKMEKKHPTSEKARMKCLTAIAKIIAENENRPIEGLYSKLEARGIKSMGHVVPVLVDAGLVKKIGGKRNCSFELTDAGKKKVEKFTDLLKQSKKEDKTEEKKTIPAPTPLEESIKRKTKSAEEISFTSLIDSLQSALLLAKELKQDYADGVQLEELKKFLNIARNSIEIIGR